MLLPFLFQCLFDSCDSMLPDPTRQRRALVGVRAVWDVYPLKPEDYPFRLLVGAPLEGASAKSWFSQWYCYSTLRRAHCYCGCAMHSSNRRLQVVLGGLGPRGASGRLVMKVATSNGSSKSMCSIIGEGGDAQIPRPNVKRTTETGNRLFPALSSRQPIGTRVPVPPSCEVCYLLGVENCATGSRT
jgi:hypothetical protein